MRKLKPLTGVTNSKMARMRCDPPRKFKACRRSADGLLHRWPARSQLIYLPTLTATERGKVTDDETVTVVDRLAPAWWVSRTLMVLVQSAPWFAIGWGFDLIKNIHNILITIKKLTKIRGCNAIKLE